MNDEWGQIWATLYVREYTKLRKKSRKSETKEEMTEILQYDPSFKRLNRIKFPNAESKLLVSNKLSYFKRYLKMYTGWILSKKKFDGESLEKAVNHEFLILQSPYGSTPLVLMIWFFPGETIEVNLSRPNFLLDLFSQRKLLLANNRWSSSVKFYF